MGKIAFFKLFKSTWFISPTLPRLNVALECPLNCNRNRNAQKNITIMKQSFSKPYRRPNNDNIRPAIYSYNQYFATICQIIFPTSIAYWYWVSRFEFERIDLAITSLRANQPIASELECAVSKCSRDPPPPVNLSFSPLSRVSTLDILKINFIAIETANSQLSQS